MKTWAIDLDLNNSNMPDSIRRLAAGFPRDTRWVRKGMHHDCDYWLPVAYNDDGTVIMQRYSGLQHTPVFAPEAMEPSRLERRKH